MSDSADNVEMTERGGGVEFSAKVVPGSSRNRIAGVWGTALRVAVTAPPQAGQANQQLIRLLADTFGVKRGDVSITHGRTQPLKRVRIVGLSAERVRQVLGGVLGGGD